MSTQAAEPALQRTLGPWLLWGLGVGYVISGEYFGWNLGLPVAGTFGMLIATGIVTVMYVAFVLSYAELACSIPHAGGAFAYALRVREPELPRPFRAIGYPIVPAVALALAVVCLGAMIVTNPELALVFGGLVGAGLVYFGLRVRPRLRAQRSAIS